MTIAKSLFQEIHNLFHSKSKSKLNCEMFSKGSVKSGLLRECLPQTTNIPVEVQFSPKQPYFSALVFTRHPQVKMLHIKCASTTIWHFISQNYQLSKLFTQHSITAYKRSTNLKDFLGSQSLQVLGKTKN